ncbi:MAG: hypothetical protein WCF85_16250 [Rhodospirillaceae bacterium]
MGTKPKPSDWRRQTLDDLKAVAALYTDAALNDLAGIIETARATGPLSDEERKRFANLVINASIMLKD